MLMVYALFSHGLLDKFVNSAYSHIVCPDDALENHRKKEKKKNHRSSLLC